MFDINSLTIGQLKEIAALIPAGFLPVTAAEAQPEKAKQDPLVGKYVIIRTYSAGVHAGELVEQNGKEVLLKDSRRLWSWGAKEGIALSGVAVSGLKSGCKIDAKVDLIRLSEAIETILCSDKSHDSISNY